MRRMPYMIETVDRPDSVDLRVATRADHLAYLTENADRLIMAGAKWSDDGTVPLGSVIVLDVDTREEAEAFAAGDPFAQAGLFGETRITNWRVAFLDRTNRL
mgnify:CR=1 FL=1